MSSSDDDSEDDKLIEGLLELAKPYKVATEADSGLQKPLLLKQGGPGDGFVGDETEEEEEDEEEDKFLKWAKIAADRADLTASLVKEAAGLSRSTSLPINGNGGASGVIAKLLVAEETPPVSRRSISLKEMKDIARRKAQESLQANEEKKKLESKKKSLKRKISKPNAISDSCADDDDQEDDMLDWARAIAQEKNGNERSVGNARKVRKTATEKKPRKPPKPRKKSSIEPKNASNDIQQSTEFQELMLELESIQEEEETEENANDTMEAAIEVPVDNDNVVSAERDSQQPHNQTEEAMAGTESTACLTIATEKQSKEGENDSNKGSEKIAALTSNAGETLGQKEQEKRRAMSAERRKRMEERALISSAIHKATRCQKALSDFLVEVEKREQRNTEMQKILKQCKQTVKDFKQEIIASTAVPGGGYAVEVLLKEKKNVANSEDAPPLPEGYEKFRTLRSRVPLAFKPHGPRWSKKDSESLIRAVTHQMLQVKMIAKLADLASTGAGEAELAEIEANRELTAGDILAAESKIDWHHIATNCFSGAKIPEDCMQRWRNVMKPGINNTPWTQTELTNLQTIVKQTGMYDWSTVAQQLGTNRTPFQCLKAYQLSFNPKLEKKDDWTKEMDDILWKKVDFKKWNLAKCTDWMQIAETLGKDPAECLVRYERVLIPARKRGQIRQWSEEESDKLRLVVGVLGEKNWRKIEDFIPDRTQTQCRERWHNVLSPALKHGSFSEEEDSKLNELVAALGSHSWSKVAKHLPGRTDNQCKRRWEALHLEELERHCKEIQEHRITKSMKKIKSTEAKSSSLSFEIPQEKAVQKFSTSLDSSLPENLQNLPKKVARRLVSEERRKTKQAVMGMNLETRVRRILPRMSELLSESAPSSSEWLSRDGQPPPLFVGSSLQRAADSSRPRNDDSTDDSSSNGD